MLGSTNSLLYNNVWRHSLPVCIGERPMKALSICCCWFTSTLHLVECGFCYGLHGAIRCARTPLKCWPKVSFSTLFNQCCPLWWQRCPAIGRDQEGTSSPSIRDCCFSSEECPHGRPAAWPCVTWMHERPGMKCNPVQWLCRQEVIMTSYQELTAEVESSPLFTDCRRAKEVINRDLDCRTHPELGSRDEEREQEAKAASRINTPHPRYSTLSNSCTFLDSPPPPACDTLQGFSAPACPHSSRVPWRCRAQGHGSPGPEYCASNNNETLQSGFGSLAEQIQIYSRNGPEIHVAMGSSAGLDCNVAHMDVSSKTFEWMRVRRSQQRAGKFFCQGRLRTREGHN